MEAPPIAVSDNKDEERALRSLVNVFGSQISAEQIVSAFCDSGKRADVAGQILFDMLGTSSSNADASQKNSDHDNVSIIKSSSTPNVSQKLSQGNGNNPRSSKVKCPPASVGAVSSFLGKDYTRSKPLASGPQETAKPMKLNAEFLPMSELWPADANMDATNKHMHKEMEDFLFKMLGVGFQLDRDVIADILGTCGYDMQKSMDKVFDYSASVLDRKINQLEDSARKHRDSSANSQTFSLQKEVQHESPTPGDSRQARNHLQKELLISLFTASERDEDLPSPIMRSTKRSNVVCAAVDEPPKKSLENKTHKANSLEDKNEEVEEDNYTLLRRAVQEHRNTMKEYDRAAIDAFKKGDHDRANKLVEKGQFFQNKAREADEESTQMMFESKNEEISSFVTLDLHEFDAKYAIRTLKHQISSLAGISSFKYLKVIIESNNEDTSKGSRRRRVMKLLEVDSIKWIEEGTAGTILIPLENLDSKQLSFAKE